MSKEKEEESSKNWKYDGSEDEWDSFDRRMIRYMRKRYDTFGEKMWLGEIDDVEQMDFNTFEDHIRDVMKAIYINDSSEARRLQKDRDEFETLDWQIDWLRRQFQLMMDYLEAHSKGQAEIEIINYNEHHGDIRKHLYKQFGAGTGGNIHEKELDFDRGMPEKGKPAFPDGCDMGEKLRQLESRRLYFLKMAGSEEQRRSYTYCQETKLVRIVLDHYNRKEYSECIKRVLESVKFRKMLERARDGEDLDTVMVSSNHDRSFSDDWLPSWKLLKASLLDEWNQRNIDKATSSANHGKGKHVLPVAMGGIAEVSCYGCGQIGHKKGDTGCKAGKFDAHANAPQDYKDRMAKKRKSNGSPGNAAKKGPGKPGGKKEKEGEKKHCHAFQS